METRIAATGIILQASRLRLLLPTTKNAKKTSGNNEAQLPVF
jgi:hypothetical protein